MFKSPARLLFMFSIAAVLIAPVLSATLFAQDSKSAVQEPEYVYHVFLMAADGKLLPLELQKTTYMTETHANVFKGLTEIGQDAVPNPKSTVRVTPDAHFIVRVPDGFDPSAMIYLKPFVLEKHLRVLPVAVARERSLANAKSTATPDTSMLVTFRKYGQNSVEIIPAKPFVPGEYAFGVTGNLSLGLACFGVNPK